MASYSFTLFLTHYSIFSLAVAFGWVSGWPAFIVLCGLSNAVAIAIAMQTEMKHRLLRHAIQERFLPKAPAHNL